MRESRRDVVGRTECVERVAESLRGVEESLQNSGNTSNTADANKFLTESGIPRAESQQKDRIGR